MPVPEGTCASLEIDLAAFLDLSIKLPGGVSLDAKLEPGVFPSLGAIVQSVLEPLNAALTPLMPFFRLLDVIIAIIDCIKAVPDSLGPPPDPTAVIKAVEKLLKVVPPLLSLIPPLSLPIMIVGICKTISAALLALVLELEHAVEASLRVSVGQAKVERLTALGMNGVAAKLQAALDCAQADLDLQASVSTGGLGPLNKFLDLLNAFMGLLGLPEIGKVDANAPNPLDVIEPLKQAVEIIATICGSIPV